MSIVVDSNPNFSDRVESIRRLVYVGYDKTDLQDAEITDDARLGEVNRAVARRIPNWADLGTDERASLEVCVCKLTAADLLKSVARTLSVDRGSASSRMEFLTIKDTIEAYLMDAESIIKDIAPDMSYDAEPYFEVININEDSKEYV